MWMALGMDEERRRAKQEVDELLASGDITSFGDWQKVVRHPPTTGASALEGHEFEGELEEGEKPYLTPDDEALVAADEADFFGSARSPQRRMRQRVPKLRGWPFLQSPASRDSKLCEPSMRSASCRLQQGLLTTRSSSCRAGFTREALKTARWPKTSSQATWTGSLRRRNSF